MVLRDASASKKAVLEFSLDCSVFEVRTFRAVGSVGRHHVLLVFKGFGWKALLQEKMLSLAFSCGS